MVDEPSSAAYGAKTAYQSDDAASGYEQREVYRGLLGRYRKRLEVRAIDRLIGTAAPGSVFLDCPCGNGRWFERLGRRAGRIVAVDVSEGMLRFAARRAAGLALEIELHHGDAERLPLDDLTVDYAFSYALMKHLPVPVQYRVLAEFARVSRRGVVCSFGVLGHLSYAVWRRRNLAESYPVLPEELGWMAGAAGLDVRQVVRCSTPIGLEHLVLFEKRG